MLSLTAVFTAICVAVLFFVLGYMVVKGGSSLNWAFFTELPKPVGESGGGMANALVGSAKLLAIAAATGLPVGFAGRAVPRPSSRADARRHAVRYAADLLNGVPSIVVGIFVYTLIVLPMKHFSALAGGLALGVMMIPIMTRSTEEFLRAVPGSLREASLALGATQDDDDPPCHRAGRVSGHRHGRHARAGPRGRRDGPVAVHRARQPLLERGPATSRRPPCR